MRITKVIKGLGIALLAGGWVAAQEVPTSVPQQFPGHTFPSERREMSLKILDVVREVPAKPGDAIKVGDTLIQQDDAEEQLRYKALKRVADSDVAERAASVQLEQAKVTKDRYEKMFQNQVASQEEWDKAKLDVDLGELQLAKAKLERDQARDQAAVQNQIIQQMKIVSSINGVVERIDVEAGEVIDPQKPAITVVTLDPLHVEVPVPSSRSLSLKVGQKLGVMYEGQQRPTEAEIIYLAPVVDARSDKQLVRLKMPNPEGRPAGLPIQLVLPTQSTANR